MPAAIEVVELEPLALSPAAAARYLSISERSLSRLLGRAGLRSARRARAHSSMSLQ